MNRGIHKISIVFGVIYGLVAAGFYVTPLMFFLMGLASISTAASTQRQLMHDYGWLFFALGLLLALTTTMIYLRRKNVERLTLAEVRPYRAFIGGISIALLLTYAILATTALFTLGI